MIIRAMGLGFVLWLVNAAVFRFGGHYFFYPQAAVTYAAVAITILAGLSVALPSLLLNAMLTYNFATIFPNLDPTLDGVYGGLAMLYAASMSLTGLMMTRLAPQDERI